MIRMIWIFVSQCSHPQARNGVGAEVPTEANLVPITTIDEVSFVKMTQAHREQNRVGNRVPI